MLQISTNPLKKSTIHLLHKLVHLDQGLILTGLEKELML